MRDLPRVAAGIGAALLAIGLAGCAAPPALAERRIEAPYERTFAAAVRALGGEGALVRADREAGRIETGWREADAERTLGLLLRSAYRERRAIALELWPEGARTGVAVRMWVEERAPGGARSLRWERVAARPEDAEALLARIEEELGK